MKQNHKYKLRYKFDCEHGDFSLDQIKKNEYGGCDAFMFASIIYPDDGSLSMQFTSRDGRNENKNLEVGDLFKVWMQLGFLLVQKGLGGWQGALVKETIEWVRENITGVKKWK
jgi:hypothetical protein